MSRNPLTEHLRQLLSAGVDIKEAVRKVLAQATRQELEEAHYPLLLDAAYGIRRQEQYKDEDNFFSGKNTGNHDETSPRVPPRKKKPSEDERVAFLSKLTGTFTLRKQTIAWIDATIDQHEEYMALIRSKMRGLEVNIDHHSRAVEVCRKYGKNSLQEVAAMGVDIDALLLDDPSGEDWTDAASDKVLT